MTKYKTTWRWGDKTALAIAAGISPSMLCDIMANRKPCSARRALALEAAAKELGYYIPRSQWAFPDMRSHWFKGGGE